MKFIALSAIRFYQRVISPRKGFCCAYAAHCGRASCSQLGYRAIRRFGVWHGLALLNGRLEKCGVAHRRYRPAATGVLGNQAGFVDCGGCDVPSGCDMPSSCHVPDLSGDTCNFLGDCPNLSGCADVGDCGCDWRRRRKGDDQYVVIPARGNVRRR